ncbi:hypothetical protein HED60_14065 [Planctomycetales bacterium ZRK34]|nr:hypothetical protein HED60_14065 [Planctomycetales bacterium ZRK34]
MNGNLIYGTFERIKKYYVSSNGREYFNFEFAPRGSHVYIYCTRHPSLHGKDRDPNKTHLFRSGELCFVAGHEPRTQREAEQRAKEWAEYFLNYRDTGVVRS